MTLCRFSFLPWAAILHPDATCCDSLMKELAVKAGQVRRLTPAVVHDHCRWLSGQHRLPNCSKRRLPPEQLVRVEHVSNCVRLVRSEGRPGSSRMQVSQVGCNRRRLPIVGQTEQGRIQRSAAAATTVRCECYQTRCTAVAVWAKSCSNHTVHLVSISFRLLASTVTQRTATHIEQGML